MRDCLRQQGSIEFRKIILKFAERFTRIEKHSLIRDLLIRDRIFNKRIYAVTFFPFEKRFTVFCGNDVQRLHAAFFQMFRHAANIAHEIIGIGKYARIHLLHDIALFRRRHE